MMASSREGHETKQESSSSINARQWPGFKNPRIVRVSRSFGGKDRHSKVCTIRGLRDRRIRLSVPTAVQLYDLQDKLGLSQPSKVVDWLIEATKLDIDKLPPLQFPQGFSQFHHHPQTAAATTTTNMFPFHESNLSLGPFYDGGVQNLMMGKSRFSWDVKGKEEAERGKWIRTSYDEEHGNHDGVVGGGYNSLQVSTQKLFPMSYNNTYHSSEPSSLSLSQFGSHGLFHSQSQVDPPHPNSGNGGVQFPSSSNLPVLSGSQLLFGPTFSAATPSSLFSTPCVTTSSLENNDPIRQFNFLNSVSNSQHYPHHPLNIPSFHSLNSPIIRLFPTPFNSKLLDSNDNNKDSNARS